MRTQHSLESVLRVRSDADTLWREITQVDLASFPHPAYLALLGIPKPVRAEIVRPGIGGARTAYFSNGLRFSQEITEWEPPTRYAFTFRPDAGFRVGHVLDLSAGPFRMISGVYRLAPADPGVWVRLSSTYELRGAAGPLLRVPVALVLRLFQTFLLRGIRANAERRSAGRSEVGANA